MLGAEHHLEVLDSGFRIVKNLPSRCWLFDGDTKKIDNLCVDSLFRLNGIVISPHPPERWMNAMKTLACTNHIPWAQVMPASQYKSYVKNIVNSAKENFNRLSKDYCRDTWFTCSSVFAALRPAKIDSAIYRSIVETDGLGNGAVETFKPGAGGYAATVQYDRFGTRTGRLTVDTGPNILTLKKEHRKILKSHFPNGKVIALDFSSLEARIILAEAGVDLDSEDVYQHISDKIFGGSVARKTVKIAVLSELYGASRSALEHRLEMGGDELDRFTSSIKSYFRTELLKSRLKLQLNRDGQIHNKFGRPLFLDSKNSDYLLINTYAQSTGADVSLLGFKNILDGLGTDGVRPIFFLHDALLLDVREDRMNDVQDIKSISIPGYSVKFPLKFEAL